MTCRKAPAISIPLLWLVLSTDCASVPPVRFFEINNVAALAPDERVVIGEIRYANGDIRDLLPEGYIASRPRFSYDLYYVGTPEATAATVHHQLGPTGGIFAFKVKRQPVYLESIAAVTRWGNGWVDWYFPVDLRLPVTSDNCVFVGEIVLSVTGERPSKWSWPENQVRATVNDTYDRDRDALSAYVQGCDLKKALTEHPSAADLDVLLARRRAEERLKKQVKASEGLLH
jgi:hypothetical protein